MLLLSDQIHLYETYKNNLFEISYNQLEIVKRNLNNINDIFDSDEWFIPPPPPPPPHYGTDNILDDLELATKVINERYNWT